MRIPATHLSFKLERPPVAVRLATHLRAAVLRGGKTFEVISTSIGLKS